jgi:hypothetical protein
MFPFCEFLAFQRAKSVHNERKSDFIRKKHIILGNSRIMEHEYQETRYKDRHAKRK